MDAMMSPDRLLYNMALASFSKESGLLRFVTSNLTTPEGRGKLKDWLTGPAPGLTPEPKDSRLSRGPARILQAVSNLLKRGAVLSAEDRRDIPRSDFAIPRRAKTPEGKARSGSYPIPDETHARAALGLVGMHGSPEEKAEVRARVAAKYPHLAKAAATGLSSSVPGSLNAAPGGAPTAFKIPPIKTPGLPSTPTAPKAPTIGGLNAG